MRHRKRWAAVLLAAAMAVSLPACNGVEKAKGTTQYSDATSANTTAQTESGNAAATDAVSQSEVEDAVAVDMAAQAGTGDTAAEASSDSESGSDSSAASDTDTIEAGTSQGGVYTNEYFQFQFTTTGSWTLYDEDQLKQVNQAAFGNQENLDVAEALKKGNLYMDAFAVNESETAMENVGVTIANIGVIYSASYDAEEILESSQDSGEQSLEDQGAADITSDLTTTEFLGEDIPCLDYSCTLSGTKVYQKIIVVERGGYFAMITATSGGTDTTQDILDMFTGLE